MTIDLLDAYVEELPGLRAERLLDATHAAHPSDDWIKGLIETVRRAAGALARTGRFTVNGVATNVAGLRRWFRSTVGGRGVGS